MSAPAMPPGTPVYLQDYGPDGIGGTVLAPPATAPDDADMVFVHWHHLAFPLWEYVEDLGVKS